MKKWLVSMAMIHVLAGGAFAASVDTFGIGAKAKMLTAEEAVERIGHAVGGVCPFALPDDVKTYLDVSLKRFETVFPAVGSAASAIELTCDELEHCCGKNFVQWVDVCKGWQDGGA